MSIHVPIYPIGLCTTVVISRHHADILHKKDSVQASEKSYQQLHQRKLYACKKGNTKLNESLEQLKSTVGDTIKLYEQTDGELDCCSEEVTTEQNSFLSAYSLDNYHSMEGNFTQALIAYTKKQFFQVSNVVSLMHKFISCYLNPAPKDNYVNEP